MFLFILQKDRLFVLITLFQQMTFIYCYFLVYEKYFLYSMEVTICFHCFIIVFYPNFKQLSNFFNTIYLFYVWLLFLSCYYNLKKNLI